ncbi:hypothetical protein QBC43DRAFT_373207 [Cladorrhinum sp. PSN259]|nr:hypothetical protein QBC43DRAFT_373207 [Cladorrhinum sp. PSN259]
MSECYESNRHRRGREGRRRSRRSCRPAEQQQPQQPCPPDYPPVAPQPSPVLLSHIHPINLEESIQGGRGQYSSVSVLEPVMRIERSGTYNRGDPGARPIYRIILSLKLQLNINRVTGEIQRHNRIFDSINVRYLYRSGERHDLLPKGDDVVTDIAMRNENGVDTGWTAGVAGAAVGHPLPAMTVHAQHASKVTYERKLRSWRKSLTYETCKPPQTNTNTGEPKMTVFSDPQPHYELRDNRQPLVSLLGLAGPINGSSESSFKVSSSHADHCSCRRSHTHCRQRQSHGRQYNRAAHWSGQTEAQLHLWTPEIYETMTCPLTVTREVDAENIDHILRHQTSDGLHELRRHLHFDFDVEVRLREIGWGFMSLFRSSSQPPEIRAQNDSGKPLHPDRSKFCVSCCTSRIFWPKYETRDLQSEAEEQIAKYGFIRRLQSPEEFQASQNQNQSSAAQSSSSSSAQQQPVSVGGSTTVGVAAAAAAVVRSQSLTRPQSYARESREESGSQRESRGRTKCTPDNSVELKKNNDQSNSISSCRRVTFSPDYHMPTYGRRRKDERISSQISDGKGKEKSEARGDDSVGEEEGLLVVTECVQHVQGEPEINPGTTLERETTSISNYDTDSSESTHRVFQLGNNERKGPSPMARSRTSDGTRRRVLILLDGEEEDAGEGDEGREGEGQGGEGDPLLGSILMSETSGYGSLFALSVIADSEDDGDDYGSAFSSSGWVEIQEK